MSGDRGQRVLAVASAGGHLSQLEAVLPAFESQTVTLVTTDPDPDPRTPVERVFVVTDANLDTKARLIRTALQVLIVVLRVRPGIVVSTGAAPGFFAVVFGSMIGARTIWLDSIANVEEMSVSGRRVRRHADMWLTQWPHLAHPDGPAFEGSVL